MKILMRLVPAVVESSTTEHCISIAMLVFRHLPGTGSWLDGGCSVHQGHRAGVGMGFNSSSSQTDFPFLGDAA